MVQLHQNQNQFVVIPETWPTKPRVQLPSPPPSSPTTTSNDISDGQSVSLKNNSLVQTYGRNSFDRFGDDLCGLLLRYLEFADRFRLESVSKQWQSLIYLAETQLVLTNDDGDHHRSNRSAVMATTTTTAAAIKLLFKKCPNITRLSVRNFRHFDDKLMLKILANCPQLQHITGTGVDMRSVSSKVWDKMFRKFGPKLLTITETFCNPRLHESIGRCLHLATNLQRLDLFDVHSTVMAYLMKPTAVAGQQFNELRHLKLRYYSSSGHRFRQFADRYGRQLVGLEMDIMCTMADQQLTDSIGDLMVGLSQMSGLAHMKLTIDGWIYVNYWSIIDSGLARIAADCSQLISLSIAMISQPYCPLLTLPMNIVHTIGQHFGRRLRQFVFCCLADIFLPFLSVVDIAFNAFKRLTQLTLWLPDVYRLGDRFVSNIGQHLPRLQRLTLRYTDISRPTLESLVDRLAHLKYLTIDNTGQRLSNIDPKIVGKINGNIVNVVILNNNNNNNNKNKLITNFGLNY